jgi:hypothetical protein
MIRVGSIARHEAGNGLARRAALLIGVGGVAKGFLSPPDADLGHLDADLAVGNSIGNGIR